MFSNTSNFPVDICRVLAKLCGILKGGFHENAHIQVRRWIVQWSSLLFEIVISIVYKLIRYKFRIEVVHASRLNL